MKGKKPNRMVLSAALVLNVFLINIGVLGAQGTPTPTPTPDCMNYNYTISTGTIVPGVTDTGNHGDDVSTVVVLPFSYQLYDQTFNSVAVGSNGHLTFGTVNDSFNVSCIPVAGVTYAIGPYWTDQCTSTVDCGTATGNGMGIFTSVSGSAPNRIFNIEWRTIYYNSNNVQLNYEVRLYEGQTAFDVVYGTIPASFTPSQLRNLSVGLQRTDMSEFVLVGCDTTGGGSPPVSTGQLYHYTLGCASPTPATLANISTRLRVETGDNVLIGGFIVSGTQDKKVIVRAIGPSLPVADALPNPFLELHDGSGNLIASNDNWKDTQQAEIEATTIPPSNDLESAIVASLPANNSAYTAIVRGVNNTTGVGLVEVYDLDTSVDSKLANISTRGLVQTGDNVMIGGFIIVGQSNQKVIVRAIGPSLANAGISNPLQDPTLELHNGNGDVIASDDNWKDSQQADIEATGIPPTNDLESAIVATLAPGNYTAIVRGKSNTTGVALVEVYALNN
jgi:hypothetical protein